MTTIRPNGTHFVPKSVTKPAAHLRGKVSLTREILVAHFAGRNQGDLVALHSTAPDHTCRWCAWDIDCHGGDAADPDRNEQAAIYWFDKLTSLGFTPILTQSNGVGGFHLVTLLDAPVPAGWAQPFAKSIVSDYGKMRLADAPEALPKSVRLMGKGFGTALRLPGRHHTRPHYSRVWDGNGTWLEGDEAIDAIVGTRPSPAALVPEPKPVAPAPPIQSFYRPRTANGGRLDERTIALACLDHVQNSSATHYDTWVAVGMALHSVDPSAGMQAEWERWSRQSAKHVDGETHRKWASFHQRGGLTLGFLVRLARQNGFDVYGHARRTRQSTVHLKARWAGV